MTFPLSSELVNPQYFAGNTFRVRPNLTLIAGPSSPGNIYDRPAKGGGTAMGHNRAPALTEIGEYLAAVARFDVPEASRQVIEKKPLTSTRADGRDVLEPAICTIDGKRYLCGRMLSDSALKILHNERPSLNPYPLSLNDGLFFSEAVGPTNDLADDYHTLMSETLSLIRAMIDRSALDFESLDIVGIEAQKLDADFARKRINRPQDRIHRCYGNSPEHPYSKITLCRTVVPINLAGDIVPFVYEKFLVAYSYLDGGIRLSTKTPLHSHPLNFETVYFTSYGPKSFVTEQEYHIVGNDGRPLIGEDGMVNRELLSKIAISQFHNVTLRRGDTHYVYPSEEPAALASFDPDHALAVSGLITQTDGLFRPHQVTVHDDHDAPCETLYYAIDNYFGPISKVLVYNSESGVPNLWSHDDWER